MTFVSFLTHDAAHPVLNKTDKIKSSGGVPEKVGCIRIGDNMFVGSGTHILFDTKIGSNVIIGTCSAATHDIPGNSVAAGVPARVIGSFDEYVEKRLKEEAYPERLRPRVQRPA